MNLPKKYAVEIYQGDLYTWESETSGLSGDYWMPNTNVILLLDIQKSFVVHS